MNDDVIEIKSDKYFNDPDCADNFKEMGMKVRPVDINGAFVPVKGDAGNLSNTEDNIRKRFSLGGEDE